MITIKWGKDDKSILLYEFEGSWSIEDLIDALDAGVNATAKYDHDMDVIVDLTKSGIPELFGVNMNKAFKRAMNRTEEHVNESVQEPGLIVIIASNPIMRNTLASLLQMYQRMGDRIAVAKTMAEAQAAVADFRKERQTTQITA